MRWPTTMWRCLLCCLALLGDRGGEVAAIASSRPGSPAHDSRSAQVAVAIGGDGRVDAAAFGHEVQSPRLPTQQRWIRRQRVGPAPGLSGAGLAELDAAEASEGPPSQTQKSSLDAAATTAAPPAATSKATANSEETDKDDDADAGKDKPKQPRQRGAAAPSQAPALDITASGLKPRDSPAVQQSSQPQQQKKPTPVAAATEGSQKSGSAPSQAQTAASKKSGTVSAAHGGHSEEEQIVDPKVEWARFSVLLYTLPVLIFLALVFECIHKRHADVNWELDVEYPSELQRIGLSNYFGDAGSWVFEYFTSSRNWCKRSGMLLFLIVDMLSNAFIGYSWTLWIGRWYDLLQHPELNKAAFPALITNFVILVCFDTIRGIYVSYVQSWFMLDWQTWMTKRFMGLWLSDRSFYLIELSGDKEALDNPDQRIADDAVMFCDSTWNLCTGFANSFLDLFIYLPMLWRLSPRSVFGYFECKGWLVYLALLWATIGTCLVHYVGRILIALKYATQRYNADYRFKLVQVRRDSESIAMLGAEHVEERTLNRQWDKIRRITWEWMFFTKRYSFAMKVFHHSERFMGLCVLVPAYLASEITLGGMRMAEAAFSSVKGDLEFFVNSYSDITDWRAAVARLKALEKQKSHSLSPTLPAALPAGQGPSKDKPPEFHGAAGMLPGKEEKRALATHDSDELSVKGLRILLPSGLLLVEVPDLFTVKPGDRVLLSGRVGSGKSTLLRALSEIWPYAAITDDGHFRLPPREDCLFVPRVPALPMGTLREAVSYPEESGTYSDEQLRQALTKVGLEEVLMRQPKENQRPGSLTLLSESEQDEEKQGEASSARAGLDCVEDWGAVLSGGEQQRVIVAHVLLKKPRLLFLDEATSSMSREMASQLYQAILEALGSEGALISISHDVSGMQQFHNKHFIVDPEKKRLHAAA
eukprot:TRINITY_DN65177_c0_g1_i1.p1 TRINITY_DN65177_c0_g1~~TRINITY_DN65177_c0_g1_i1.p1  ORF type:complete len:929 (-),score=246.84 TRINITY_DN65177_c0_g1_i1:223-3009(-)